MGKGRFVNQKLGKRTSFREWQAAGKRQVQRVGQQMGQRSDRPGQKPPRAPVGQRGIIKRSSSQ